MYTPARIGLIFIIMTIALMIYVSALYRIQVYDTWESDNDEQLPRQRRITRMSTIHAARGNIYDRNGVLLASGRPSYNIKLDWWLLRNAADTNASIQELVYATMDEGISYTDTFPVTRGAPFEYLSNMTSVQRNRLNAYFEFHKLDPEINVSDLLAWFYRHYKIDYTVNILDARLIIGVRYELEVRIIMGTINPYVFAYDVSTDFVSYLEERGLTGVYAESTYVREYHTAHASHLLGYIGAMTPEEYERYRESGYPMDAVVGKVGAELAFEELLYGASGQRVVTLLENGTIIGDEVTKEPEPGSHVYLTIDLGLQTVAEHVLRTRIEAMNLLRDDEEEEPIPGGAVVVTNVHTGEILAAASYPTFNLTTLSEDWAFLNADPTFPMLNRATQGRYSPGSTFKMVTAFAALRHGVIGRYLEINDTGIYTAYDDFTPSCWIFSERKVGHGLLNVVQALECSCNYFFIAVSDWFPGGWRDGAKYLAEAAQEFGLGRTTGLEIPEYSGRLATPEVKLALPNEDDNWYNADTLTAGFGQGLNRFTPVQLANYSATIANGGTLYSLSILRRVLSSDFEVTYQHEPEVLNEIEEKEFLEIIQEGMLAVSRGNRGTARSVFSGYKISVASKTGTVQVEGAKMNDGVFVCYAPANNPEIAISIVVEKGGSGSAIMDIARMIFDHYFMTENTFQATPYGELIP